MNAPVGTDLRLYKPESRIEEAWRPLAVHADQCDVCLPHVARLVGAEDPRKTDFEVYDELCDEGKALFTVWRLAKDEWLARTWERRRRQFITDEQLAADGVDFDLRSRAIMSMPAQVFDQWRRLPDDVRHARLRALENGLVHERAVAEPQRVGKKCQGCDRENTTGGRFHSRACREKWEAEHGC